MSYYSVVDFSRSGSTTRQSRYNFTDMEFPQVKIVYSSFADRIDSFKQSYTVFFDDDKIREYFNDEDRQALEYLNGFFSPILHDFGASLKASGKGTADADIYAIISNYIENCHTNTALAERRLTDPNSLEYPYFDSNIIDKAVSTDYYYEIKCIDKDKFLVIIYKEFIDVIGSHDNSGFKLFIKKVLIAVSRSLSIPESARTSLFKKYLQLLK
jgi:hypothetical protein